jgi:hypothetical protein
MTKLRGAFLQLFVANALKTAGQRLTTRHLLRSLHSDAKADK